jgi:hypothetical protein
MMVSFGKDNPNFEIIVIVIIVILIIIIIIKTQTKIKKAIKLKIKINKDNHPNPNLSQRRNQHPKSKSKPLQHSIASSSLPSRGNIESHAAAAHPWPINKWGYTPWMMTNMDGDKIQGRGLADCLGLLNLAANRHRFGANFQEE